MNKAKIAKEENEKAQDIENNRLGLYNEMIDNYTTRSTSGGEDISQLKEALKTLFVSSSDPKISDTFNISNNVWTTVWQYTAAQDEYVNLNGWIAYPTNGTGSRFVSVSLGGSRIYYQSNLAGSANTSNNGFNVNLAVKTGETIIIEAYQSSGSTLSVSTSFYFKKINL